MSDLPLTPEDVNAIVAILDGSGYDRLDIATSRFRLRVRREGGGWSQDWEPVDAPAPADAVAAAEQAPVPDGMAAIPAPLPGTFYRAPSPGAPPFVAEGDEVTAETVIGIVETMKLMNPVHAGAAGRIAAILVANAGTVEAGTVLMHLAPR